MTNPEPPPKPPKKFSMEHLYLPGVVHFNETNAPSWLTHKANNWFYQKHVLTLAVGASVKTEFRKITRTF